MIRRYILFAVSLIVLLGSLTAAFATAADRDFQLRGYADATQDSPLPYRVPRLGVNAELLQYDETELRQQLDLMQQAHMVWVRQHVRWNELEPEPGHYDWTEWDKLIAGIDAYPDLRLVVVLVNSPTWSRNGGTLTAPPADPLDFARFAGIFSERYGHAIDFYQVWDEPNLTEAWGETEPRAAHYVAMLQSVYRAIHSADSTATVLAAALAPTVEKGPLNISDIDYLRDLYALGAKDYMDAVAAKPFGFNDSPADRTVADDRLNFSRIVALREVMVEAGDGAKALWASQWGWNSLPSDWVGPPSIWGQVSAQERIQFTLQALERAEREWPWLGGMILHHWQPHVPPDNPLWGFALVDRSGSPTALWEALIARTPAVYAVDGLYPPANPYARYSGVWTFGPLGADIGWVNDSRFEFDFWGRDVALLLREDDYVAYLYPTVDGQPANALPRDVDGNAYLVLTSASLEPEQKLIPVARDLQPAMHKLQVIADDLVPDEAQDRWALAGYAVSSGDLRQPYNRQLIVAWITVCAALIAVVITGTQIPWKQLGRPFGFLWKQISGLGQLAISAATSIALMVGMLLTWGDATPALFRRETVQLGAAIATAGLVYLEPGFIITLAALAVLFVIFYHRQDIGLLLTLFWAPFFLFPVELLQFAFPIAEMLLLLTVMAWLLRLLSDWGRLRQTGARLNPLNLKLSGLDWAITAWVILGVTSLIWAELRPQAMTDLRVTMIEPALFYIILRTRCSDKKTQLALVDALIAAGFTISVIGFLMFLRGESIITAEAGVPRLASVYGSPNNLGLFLGRCLPFALAFALASIDLRRRILAASAFAAMLLAAVMSQSAGAIFLGVPAAVASVLLLKWGRRAVLLLSGLAAVGTFLLSIALRSARFARLLDFESGTNFARLRVWQSALNIISDHPITGIGPDQFLYAFRGTYILPDAWQEPNLSHPHNIVLDFWLRLGIIGVVVLCWIQAQFWLKACRLFHELRTSDPLYAALMAGVMSSMVNLLSHGLVDNSVFVNDLAYVFVFLLAVTANLSNVRAIDAGT